MRSVVRMKWQLITSPRNTNNIFNKLIELEKTLKIPVNSTFRGNWTQKRTLWLTMNYRNFWSNVLIKTFVSNWTQDDIFSNGENGHSLVLTSFFSKFDSHRSQHVRMNILMLQIVVMFFFILRQNFASFFNKTIGCKSDLAQQILYFVFHIAHKTTWEYFIHSFPFYWIFSGCLLWKMFSQHFHISVVHRFHDDDDYDDAGDNNNNIARMDKKWNVHNEEQLESWNALNPCWWIFLFSVNVIFRAASLHLFLYSLHIVESTTNSCIYIRNVYEPYFFKFFFIATTTKYANGMRQRKDSGQRWWWKREWWQQHKLHEWRNNICL